MEGKEKETNIGSEDQRIVINFDFDDVLNDLTNHWRKVHHDATGEYLDFTQWNLHEISDFGYQIYDYFGLHDFFENCPPKDGLSKVLQFVENNTMKFTYRIVSHCTGKAMENYESVLLQKTGWLKKYMNEDVADKLILTGEPKSTYPADVVIDDKINNLHDCRQASVLILMRVPHNRTLSVENVRYDYGIDIHIVNDLKECVELLQTIEDKGLEYFNKNDNNDN